METKFADWLSKTLEDRAISKSELAARMKVHRGTVSRIVTGERGVGYDVARKVARALELPEETVLEKAGLLKPFGNAEALKSQHWELISLFNEMTDDEQEEELATLRLRVERRRRGGNGKRSPGNAHT